MGSKKTTRLARKACLSSSLRGERELDHRKNKKKRKANAVHLGRRGQSILFTLNVGRNQRPPGGGNSRIGRGERNAARLGEDIKNFIRVQSGPRE